MIYSNTQESRVYFAVDLLLVTPKILSPARGDDSRQCQIMYKGESVLLLLGHPAVGEPGHVSKAPSSKNMV